MLFLIINFLKNMSATITPITKPNIAKQIKQIKSNSILVIKPPFGLL